MSARPDQAQLNVKVPRAFKTKLAADAKKAKRTLSEEIVFHCTLKERMRADLAAGRVPPIDADPAPAPAASAAAAPASSQAADDLGPLAPEAIALLRSILSDCQDVDTDSCISQSNGRQLVALLARAPGG